MAEFCEDCGEHFTCPELEETHACDKRRIATLLRQRNAADAELATIEDELARAGYPIDAKHSRGDRVLELIGRLAQDTCNGVPCAGAEPEDKPNE